MKNNNIFNMAVGLVIVGTLIFSGCGTEDSATSSKADINSSSSVASAKSTTENESTGSEASSNASGSGLKIGMVTFDSGADAYQSAYYDTMVSYAEENGVDLQILDPMGDSTEQASMVEDLIGMKCDVIIIWPANSETGISEAKKCSDAGIPVVAANTDISEEGHDYVTCYVGPSNRLEGENSAKVMIDDLGDDANIVEISNQAGYTASIERMGGMEDLVAETNIKILDNQPGEANREKSQQVMENYLVKYGKGEIDAVFCYDDTTAYGAINAIEAAGRSDDVKVYAAAAGNYETLDYIRNGKIQAISMQSPIIDAQTTLDMAIQVANGKEPDEYYNYIETPAATADNVDSLNLEAW